MSLTSSSRVGRSSFSFHEKDVANSFTRRIATNLKVSSEEDDSDGEAGKSAQIMVKLAHVIRFSYSGPMRINKTGIGTCESRIRLQVNK